MEANRPAEIKNNKEEIPLQFYLERFPAIDPVKRAEELGIIYQETEAGKNGTFKIRMLYTDYEVRWPEGTVTSEDPEALAVKRIQGQIMLLRYIMEGKSVLSSGSYMTFREMPWGEVYIKPFTGRCLTRSAYKFGTNAAGFRRGSEAVGGAAVNHGDAAYEFDFIGPYKLQILIWEGDDEFPPNAQILYSDNFATGFSAEDCVVAAELTITAISEKMNVGR
ncbi:MAG: DUF3786 domain-containing protein [Lachnospiraceae bacterium]|nr:DUF3786 domain-containing protein [Lachnospiraceae bacterium]